MGCQRLARRPHPELQSDASYDVGDLLPPVRDVNTYNSKLFAVPFYGESSILMYNKQVMDKAGVTIPQNPTWQQVADAAKKVNTADMAGICMRGKPGWGDLFAPLTTVVQTFGGNWYDSNWKATVDTRSGRRPSASTRRCSTTPARRTPCPTASTSA